MPRPQRSAAILPAAGDGTYSVRWLQRHDEAGVGVGRCRVPPGHAYSARLAQAAGCQVEVEPSDMPEYAPERGYALMVELERQVLGAVSLPAEVGAWMNCRVT
jgi:hypothetical protein